MALTVILGTAVNFVIDGHSAVNGAVIPADATLALTSSDPAIATIPATAPGGTQEIIVPVTGVAAGATDIGVTITLTDGTVLTASDSLIVGPVPVPGLTHITAQLVSA